MKAAALKPNSYFTNGTDLYCFQFLLPDGDGVMCEDVRHAQPICLTVKQFCKLRKVQPRKTHAR